MTKDNGPSHPLDHLDQDACYQTMMSERTTLITARRESEDNLVKTIIQLSTTMIALTAGFATQSKVTFSNESLMVAVGGIFFLAVATLAGLLEHWFASKAYGQQQKFLEDYYTKKIDQFSEAHANRFVRWSQLSALISFTLAMICVSILAILQIKESSNVSRFSTNTASAASTAAASTNAAPASAACTTAAAAEGDGCIHRRAE